MSFNINNFASDLRTRGVVRSHSFMANIIIPKILRGRYGANASKYIIRCDAASLPSSSFLSGEFHRYGFGPQESSPYSVSFEPVNLSFIMDSQAETYAFFYSWMNSIINYNLDTGINVGTERSTHLPYEVGYKTNYATDVYIYVYNEIAQTIIQVALRQAYPISLSEVALSWQSQDEIVRLNVPFYYRDFSIKTITPKTLADTASLNVIPRENLSKNQAVEASRIYGLNPPGVPPSRLESLTPELIIK